MEYSLDLRKIRNQRTERLSDKFFGKDPEGNELGFNTYYMEINGQPFSASAANAIIPASMKTSGRTRSSR